MKKKQMKKSKSLNNKKTHKKTGGIAGYDIRGKVAQGLNLDKDALKLKDKGIVKGIVKGTKGTKETMGYEIDVKEINQLFLRIYEFSDKKDIGFISGEEDEKEPNRKKYFGLKLTEEERNKIQSNFTGVGLGENAEINNELAAKLLFRDSRKQRLFKEYNIAYYELEQGITNTDKTDWGRPFTDEIKINDSGTGLYAKFNGKNIITKSITMRLPFIINRVYEHKKEGSEELMIEYKVPLKWALTEYLKINNYGVTFVKGNPGPNTIDNNDYKKQLKQLFTCFEHDRGSWWGEKKHDWGINPWDDGVKTDTDQCPKRSEVDDFLPLLAAKDKESEIWVTIKEPISYALIGVKARSYLDDNLANDIFNIGTHPKLIDLKPIVQYDNIIKIDKKTENTKRAELFFDARKIFNRKGEYYTGMAMGYARKNYGWGLDGYVNDNKLRVPYRKKMENIKTLYNITTQAEFTEFENDIEEERKRLINLADKDRDTPINNAKKFLKKTAQGTSKLFKSTGSNQSDTK